MRKVTDITDFGVPLNRPKAMADLPCIQKMLGKNRKMRVLSLEEDGKMELDITLNDTYLAGGLSYDELQLYLTAFKYGMKAGQSSEWNVESEWE